MSRGVALRVADVLYERLTDVFLSAFLLMLLVPQFTPWHPGYWSMVALYLAARVIFVWPQLHPPGKQSTPSK